MIILKINEVIIHGAGLFFLIFWEAVGISAYPLQTNYRLPIT